MYIENGWPAFIVSGNVEQYLEYKKQSEIDLQILQNVEQKEIAHGGNRDNGACLA